MAMLGFLITGCTTLQPVPIAVSPETPLPDCAVIRPINFMYVTHINGTKVPKKYNDYFKGDLSMPLYQVSPGTTTLIVDHTAETRAAIHREKDFLPANDAFLHQAISFDTKPNWRYQVEESHERRYLDAEGSPSRRYVIKSWTLTVKAAPLGTEYLRNPEKPWKDVQDYKVFGPFFAPGESK